MKKSFGFLGLSGVLFISAIAVNILSNAPSLTGFDGLFYVDIGIFVMAPLSIICLIIFTIYYILGKHQTRVYDRLPSAKIPSIIILVPMYALLVWAIIVDFLAK